VKGPAGKVDLRIIGVRKGMLGEFWTDVEARFLQAISDSEDQNSDGSMTITQSVSEQPVVIEPEPLEDRKKLRKGPGYGLIRKKG